MNIVFLGIGANLGDRDSSLKNAISGIGEHIGSVLKSSSIYETDAWGFETSNKFLNMVVEVETQLSPSGVLGAILMIEAHLGRIRSEKQYSSRAIDIDILLYDDLIIDKKSLKVPHPLMHERQFVLVPLCEIAPELIHPILKKPISSLIELCPDKTKVEIYRPHDRRTARPQDNSSK